MSSYGVKGIFNTLHGEGARAGTRAVVVAFSQCNLWDGHPLHRDQGEGPCARWCDADFLKGTVMDTEEVLTRMHAAWPADGKPRWCVLTGGEPALQVDVPLVLALHAAGWQIAVETNGTVPNPAVEKCDWVCVSPKFGTAWANLGVAHEIKVVLPGAAPGEYGWTEASLRDLEQCTLLLRGAPRPVLFVQPQDPLVSPDLVEQTALNHGVGVPRDHAALLADALRANTAHCVEWVMRNPHWRLSVQAQKLFGLQ